MDQEKFTTDWKKLFPGEPIPDLGFFQSKQKLDIEILQCQRRVNDVKIKLQKEEFLLQVLKKLKEDKNFQSSLNKKSLTAAEDLAPPSGQLLSLSDRVYSPSYELDSSHNKDGNIFTSSTLSTFSSFKPATNRSPSLPEADVAMNQLSTFGSKQNIAVKSSSTSEDKGKLPPPTKPRRRSTNPSSESLSRPLPKPPGLSTLPRNFGSDVGKRKVSFDSAMLRSSTFTTSKDERKKHSMSMDLSRLEFVSNEPIASTDNSDVTRSQESLEQQLEFSESDSDDYEHIYTDISELKKPPLAIPDEELEISNNELLEEKEQIYENFQMQPKLEKINDLHTDEPPFENNEKKLFFKKRLGSEDRQGLMFSDELDVTASSGEGSLHEMEGILRGSNENLATDIPHQIVVEVEDLDETFEDDDEHIYANLEDLNIAYKDSDNDSDHDAFMDSISGGIPSPNYRAMTLAEIMSLQKPESDDDINHSQDDSEDSDELSVNNSRLKRARPSSAVCAPCVTQSEKPATISRNASSPVKETNVVKYPGETEEEEKQIKASRMRKYLAMNLLDSEKCYYDCLEILIKFMKPLRVSTESSQPILSSADFKSIFHQSEDLFTMHKEFLTALEPRIEHWNEQQLLGDLFSMIMQGFGIYSSYIGNYKAAMDTVIKCKNANQQFAAIMEQDIRIPSIKDPLKLDRLLYKPVDRMTQYSLILNDLLKYTSPDHPDHPLIVEVSGALFDLFEQVNVDSSKKKRRQRQLLKEAFVVEIDDGERRPRNLILFNDVIISAKLKPTKDAFVCKWYAALADINLKPYPNSEGSQVVPVSSKIECDKLRASIAHLRQEIRKDHMPLQQTVSIDSSTSSPPFMKRRNHAGPRSSSRGIEKIKKKISEQEGLLQMISPNIPFNLYHKSGKTYTLLVYFEAERQAWIEALKPRLKRIHARNPPTIQLSSLELQQAFETVLKLQRLGATFGSNLPSPFMGSTRPLSLDMSKYEDDKESLTGYLFVNINQGKGFTKSSDTYVVLEIDSYGHFFRKAKTKPARGAEPQWDESFEFEVEACTWLRLSCYNKLRLMGDDISGKVSVNLTRESLVDGKNRVINVVLDRGQSTLNVSLCFSTSIDGIKKSATFISSAVFGAPISVVAKREQCDIPVIVITCIKEIEKRGMDEIGIYRLSGVASEIQNLKKLFNEQTQTGVVALAESDIHAVAGLLKLYFRELPQSLFTSKLYHKFVEGLSITDPEDKELYMCDVLQELPRVNKLTALYLFEHLRRVVLQENENKMGVNNLATVFGPTVLRPPSSNSDKENERNSCNVGTFDIGALDVMSQVGIFRYFLGLKNNERTRLPPNDLELWRKLDPDKAIKIEEKLLETAEEHLI